MGLLKFYSYIFYKIKKDYHKWTAVFVIMMLLGLNLMTIITLYTTIYHLNIDDLIFFSSSSDYFVKRGHILFVDILPLLLLIFFIYYLFRNKIDINIVTFENNPKEINRKWDKRVKWYAYISFYMLGLVMIITAIIG